MSNARKAPIGIEWPTLGLLILVYVVWGLATVWVAGLSLLLAVLLTTFSVALHSSLQHEVLHGHPFKSRFLSELMVFPAIGLCIPYIRFRETHLAHHNDSILTDPYDDPETNYQDPAVWAQMPAWLRGVLNFNNTLIGRLLIGPLIAQVAFMRADWALIRRGDRSVAVAWLWHLLGVALVAAWLIWLGNMPFWAYAMSAYAGLSILKIRTFLEHQAHERARGRTVIIEDRGPLAFIFLNNSLHVVHHMHPKVPWYRLPQLFRDNRDRYLSRNDGYYYRSYGEIFRKHLFKRKDDVPHPLWTPPTK